MKVVVDTNFIILPFTRKIDIFEDIKYLVEDAQIIVFDIVLEELKKVRPLLYEGVIKLIDIKNVKITKIQKTESVDDTLLGYCISNKTFLATFDKELKQKALKKGVPLIITKGRRIVKG